MGLTIYMMGYETRNLSLELLFDFNFLPAH